MSKYMYIFQPLYILTLFYCMVLNGKMGEPNAYLYENCRTTIAKLLLGNDFKSMVKASK